MTSTGGDPQRARRLVALTEIVGFLALAACVVTLVQREPVAAALFLVAAAVAFGLGAHAARSPA